MTDKHNIVVLGIYAADSAYKASRLPTMGETLIGSGFKLGPGGKGSNQSVAVARSGGDVAFISKIGNDPFGEMALDIYKTAGVHSRVDVHDDLPTGAAFIFVDEKTGNNAIIVYPGAAGTIDNQQIDANKNLIEGASVFVTQLEQPVPVTEYAIKMAKNAGVTTILNPAPAPAPENRFDDSIYGYCDFIVPNESEAEILVGFPVITPDDAKKAGQILCERGAKTALITLGENGIYIHNDTISQHVPAIPANVVETTGAGDAFVGGFATALSEGKDILSAVMFGNATASIAVSRAGAATSMPTRVEVENLLQKITS